MLNDLTNSLTSILLALLFFSMVTYKKAMTYTWGELKEKSKLRKKNIQGPKDATNKQKFHLTIRIPIAGNHSHYRKILCFKKNFTGELFLKGASPLHMYVIYATLDMSGQNLN